MSEKLNICLLNDSFPPIIDGVANAVVNYGKHISGSHGNAVVVTPVVPGYEDPNMGFPVVRYPGIDLRKSTGYMAGLPFSLEIIRSLKDENISLLHTHCPIVSTFLARELRRQLDVPVVLTYHTKYDIDIANTIHSRTIQEGSLKALVENISSCDEIWTVSEGAGNNLRSLGYRGDYLVMPNGVDLSKGKASSDAVASVTGDFDLPDGIPVYLFVGRMMWYKGLKIILDALSELKKAGSPFRMVFVGSGGDMEEVIAYTNSLGLNDVCFFAGTVTDREAIRAWYTRADLFLFPSTFDTNGLVVREAAACSLATVLIKGSCASEGTIDGQNVFQIEETADALAAKLTEVGSNFELMQKVGEAASNELYLSWEDAVDKAYHRYEIVVENYRKGLYPSHDTHLDRFWETQGDMMESIYRIQQHRLDTQKRIRSDFLELEDRVDHLNDRLLELQAHMHEQFLNDKKELHRIREDLHEEFLSFWDRYL